MRRRFALCGRVCGLRHVLHDTYIYAIDTDRLIARKSSICTNVRGFPAWARAVPLGSPLGLRPLLRCGKIHPPSEVPSKFGVQATSIKTEKLASA